MANARSTNIGTEGTAADIGAGGKVVASSLATIVIIVIVVNEVTAPVTVIFLWAALYMLVLKWIKTTI